ncbi:hypothetical protein C8Q76DRAFT_715907 [Earliella scabrosa]|nr:hypothetical protein C8Q76DRAFT_715907 [Earliella scabrosa]
MAKVSTLIARTDEGISAIADALRAFPTLPVNEDHLREMVSTLDRLRELYHSTWDAIYELQTAIIWYRDQLARAVLDAQTINARLDAFPHECSAAVQYVADTALVRVSEDIRQLALVIKEPLQMMATIVREPGPLPDDVASGFAQMVRGATNALAEIATCARRHTECGLERENALLAHDVINLRTRIAALEGTSDTVLEVSSGSEELATASATSVDVVIALRDLRARVERLEIGRPSIGATDIEAGVKAYLAGLGLTDDRLRALASSGEQS